MARDIAQYMRTPASSVISTNSVIRNTYILLSATLLFSALCAGLGMMANVPPMNGFMVLLAYMGILFGVHAFKNSAMGILFVFLLTGFMGFTLGPVLNFYVATFSNGSELVMTALGGTGIVFLGLSGYALTTRKDFSYLTGFMVAGSLVLLLAIIAGFFIRMPAFHLMLSGAFVLFSSAAILFETSQIIQGGQRNYILATVSLYVSIINLFMSLLQILAAVSGRRE